MGTRMRWALLTVVSMLALWGPGAEAQGTSSTSSRESTPDTTKADITSDIERTRADIQLRREALVEAAMDLEPKHAEVFWPVYRAYRNDMADVNDRYIKLIVGYAENYDTLSDQLAARILRDYLHFEQDRLAVKAKYVALFQKVLPARRVVRFFEVDSKLDAIVNAQLAVEIPLR